MPPQYGLSAALGASFLIVSILLVYGYRRIVGQSGRLATITGKGYRPRLISLGKWRYPAFGAFVLYFTLTIALPTLILLWRSLVRYYMMPSWSAMAQVTLKNYWEVFAEEQILRALINTLTVGLATATLTMILCLIVAWVVVRSKIKGRALLDGLTFLPHAIPGVTIGIALIFLYLNPPFNALPLYGSVWIMVLGLTVGYTAFGSRAMNGAIAQIHNELEEAGKVSGAAWSTIMRRIILPLLLPAFISGWIWIASHSLRSFSVPLILSSQNSVVLSVVMWDLWNNARAGATAALGVLLIVTLAILTLSGRWLVDRLHRQN